MMISLLLLKQAAPGPPPREGLEWKPQTRRWIRPEEKDSGLSESNEDRLKPKPEGDEVLSPDWQPPPPGILPGADPEDVIISYTPSLDIRNIDALPRGTGARYLVAIRGQGEELVASRWARVIPKSLKSSEVLVDMKRIDRPTGRRPKGGLTGRRPKGGLTGRRPEGGL